MDGEIEAWRDEASCLGHLADGKSGNRFQLPLISTPVFGEISNVGSASKS